MLNEPDNLILEHLRHIRTRVDQIAADATDLKHRMTSLGGAMSLGKRQVAYRDETDARQQAAMDKLVSPIEQIERHLELHEG